MAKKYEKEFKVMIVELLQSGQKVIDVSEEYGLNESMIRRWRREYESERPAFTGKGVASLTDKEREIKVLKQQLREAQIEVEILKKAMGIVSKTGRKNII
jgi:transposase